MKDIHKEYVIESTLEKVWDALVNPKTIEEWSGTHAHMSDKEGDRFKLWGGDIWGKNMKVVPQELLVQEWYGGNWKNPSIATFTLVEKNGKVHLTLNHTEIPKDVDSFDKGWDEYYLGAIKELLES